MEVTNRADGAPTHLLEIDCHGVGIGVGEGIRDHDSRSSRRFASQTGSPNKNWMFWRAGRSEDRLFPGVSMRGVRGTGNAKSCN
jgi:hypothetical protein